MSDITFDDYRKDPNGKRLVKALEAKWGTPLPEFIEKLVLDTGTKAEWRVQNAKRWISKLDSLVKNIINAETNAEHYPLFWIYLFGVISEYYEDQMEFKEIKEKISFMKPIIESLDLIRSRFNENELIFIKFVRDSHVHIHLDSLWIRPVMRNGELINIKPPSNPTAREIADSILDGHGNNLESIALDYAERIISDIEKLVEAVGNAARE